MDGKWQPRPDNDGRDLPCNIAKLLLPPSSPATLLFLSEILLASGDESLQGRRCSL